MQKLGQNTGFNLPTTELDDRPSWSPDGVKLVYAAFVTCALCPLQTDIFTIAADGSGEQRLTSTFESEIKPFWGQ